MPTFRLDRISDLEVCSARFLRPDDFDAHRYLQKRMPFIQSDYQVDVWIDMLIEEAERTFAPWRIATEEQDGGTRLRRGRDRLEMFAAMLLSTGRRMSCIVRLRCVRRFGGWRWNPQIQADRSYLLMRSAFRT